MSSLYFDSNSRNVSQNPTSFESVAKRAASSFNPRSQSLASRANQFSSSFMSIRSSTASPGNNYVFSKIKGTNHQQPSSTSLNMLKVALVVIGAVAIVYLMNKAYADGRAAGEAAGRIKGRIEGLAEGEARGLAAGEARGLAEGEARGLAAGETKGRAAGYAAGHSAGYDAGHAAGKNEGCTAEYDYGYTMGKWDGGHDCIAKCSAEYKRGIAKGIEQAESAFREARIQEIEPRENHFRPYFYG